MAFIKLNKSENTLDLLKDPACFVLLAQIALRARRDDTPNIHGLKKGQALVGDLSSIGLKRSVYRRAIKRLSDAHLIDHQTTNRGTVVTIVDNSVFDINILEDDHQTTIKQPSDDHQTTTKQPLIKNKEVIKKKKEKLFDDFWSSYPNKKGKSKAKQKFLKLVNKDNFDDVMKGLEQYNKEIKKKGTEKDYIKHPLTWLNGEHWEDEYDVPEDYVIEDLSEVELARLCCIVCDVRGPYYTYLCDKIGEKTVLKFSSKADNFNPNVHEKEDLPKGFISLVDNA